MAGVVIVSRDDRWVGHDGAEGVSPDGWLPDRVTVGALTKTFPPGLIDEVVEATDTREVRRRLLPARLVVYKAASGFPWTDIRTTMSQPLG